MTENVTNEKPKGLTKSGCLTIFLAFFIVFAVGFGIMIFGIGSFLSQERHGSIITYCRAARLSVCESYIRNNGVVGIKGCVDASTGYKALESKKFKTKQEMLDQLPESFSEAIEDALVNGKSEEAFDMDRTSIYRCYISEDKLPLDEPNSLSDVEHYYFVYKYQDGSYRFAIIVSIINGVER